ncbi:MAG TPA: CpXC domain-containing protein [Ktedonobacterales bacterium]
MPARSHDVTLTCPCGESFTATVYSAVNVTLEPRLLYRLLAGQLNVATCPNCGRQAETAQPFVYHDMRRGLFAYVYPTSDVEPEDRDTLLESVRRAYVRAVEESDRIAQPPAPRSHRTAEPPLPRVRRRSPADDIEAALEPHAPPMQVIFGVPELAALVESLLEPEEKLARVALAARGAGEAERARLRAIASRMAEQLQCETQVEEDGGEYTVWIYGPRGGVNTIAQALNARP